MNQRTTHITFDPDVYEFAYEAVDYAVISNFTFTHDLPSGATPTLTCTKNDQVATAIDAGEYVITLSWAGNDNEEACFDTATLTVTKKLVTLHFTQEYTYTGNDIVPELISVDGDFDDVTQADLAFAYYNSSNQNVTRIIHADANNYTFTVALTSDNYRIEDGLVFNLKVNKAEFDVVFGEMSYVYGHYGQFTFDEITYSISPAGVSRINYELPNGTYVNLSVTLPSADGGVYELTDSDLNDTADYDFSFASNSVNTITISKRTLNVTMKLDNNSVPAQSCSVEYTGASQNHRVTFAYGNFAQGEGLADIEDNLEITTRGTSLLVLNQTAIKNVGVYTINLVLHDNLNYLLDNTVYNVTVEKARLEINVGNVIIQEREYFIEPALTLDGLVGSDVGMSAADLKGANIGFNTDYTTSARAGTIFSVSVTASFDNYNAVVNNQGTVSVVANDYPQYSLSNARFVYDGTYKTISIPDVDPAVSVVYSNNSHREAGTYNVRADVTYPSGRTEELNAHMTIDKATPILTVPRINTVYYNNANVSDDWIVGTATVAGREIEGAYSFLSAYVLQTGINLYGYRFVPDDRLNVNVYEGTLEINAVAVNMSIFSFTPSNGITYNQVGDNDAKVTVTKPTRLYIADNPLGLILYRDEYRVDEYVEFSKTERVRVSVKLGDQEVYYVVYDVKYSDVDETPVVKIDSTALRGTGLTVDGKSIKVSKEGGRITLAEELKSEYNLYVNGYQTDSFILNGNEEMVTVIIRSKANDKTVFSGKFTVTLEEESKEEVKKNYTIYYVIGGVGGGLLIAGGVFLFLWKRKNG